MSDTKFFRAPFAVTGDREAIPDTAQLDGSISYPEGYGFNYERDPATDPDALRIGRETFNAALYDVTANLRQYQTQGFPQWVTAAQNGGVALPYSLNAYVRHNDVIYVATVEGAVLEPGVAVGWEAEWTITAPVDPADLKATQTETDQGTGTGLVGAVELVKAAREGRWTYAGAATYATAADLTVTLPGGAAFVQVAGAQVAFIVAAPNTGTGMTLKVGALAALPLRGQNGDELLAGDLQPGEVYTAVSNGTQWRLQNPTPSQLARLASAGDGAIFGYIATNTPGNTTTHVTMGFGNCRDSTNQRSIPRTSPMTKALNAVWAPGNGNGGRDQAGAPAAGETWHVFAILNDNTGATDILLSKSVAAPTLPAGFTFFRRVFSFILDAAAAIRQWLHLGDWVALKTRGVEWIRLTNGVAAGTLWSVGVPTGLKLLVQFYYQSQGVGGTAANPAFSGIYDPDQGVPTFGSGTQWAQVRVSWNNSNDRYQTRIVEQWCNTNAQVYTASNDTGDVIAGGVLGWYDYRGRFV